VPRERLCHGLEQTVIYPVRPVVPVIALIIRSRADDEVCRVQTLPVMASRANHLIRPDDLSIQYAVHEPVRGHLSPPESGLAGADGVGHQAAILVLVRCPDE